MKEHTAQMQADTCTQITPQQAECSHNRAAPAATGAEHNVNATSRHTHCNPQYAKVEELGQIKTTTHMNGNDIKAKHTTGITMIGSHMQHRCRYAAQTQCKRKTHATTLPTMQAHTDPEHTGRAQHVEHTQ